MDSWEMQSALHTNAPGTRGRRFPWGDQSGQASVVSLCPPLWAEEFLRLVIHFQRISPEGSIQAELAYHILDDAPYANKMHAAQVRSLLPTVIHANDCISPLLGLLTARDIAAWHRLDPVSTFSSRAFSPIVCPACRA